MSLPRLLLPVYAALIFIGAACTHETEAPTATVTGTVRDTHGQTLEGVAVTSDRYSTATDDEGRFVLTGLPAGDRVFSFSADDYVETRRTVALMAGHTHDINITMERDPVVRSIVFTPASLDFNTEESVLTMRVEPDLRKGAAWSLDTESCTWLSASPSDGFMEPGETVTLTFTADRTAVDSPSTAIAALTIGDNNSAIIATISPKQEEVQLTADPVSLDFGTDASTMPLTIGVKGPGAIQWHAAAGHKAISLSLAGGSTVSGQTDTQVTVSIDRTLFIYRLDSEITVIAGDKSIIVPVSAINTGNESEVLAPDDFTYRNDSPALPATLEPAMIDLPEWTAAFKARIESDGSILWSATATGEPICWLNMSNGTLRFIAGAENNHFNYAETWWNFSHSTLTDGEHHIVLTQRAGEDIRTVRLYVDGNEASEIYYSAETPTGAATLRLGAPCPRPGNIMHTAARMKLTDVRFYGRALAVSEINALANQR